MTDYEKDLQTEIERDIEATEWHVDLLCNGAANNWERRALMILERESIIRIRDQLSHLIDSLPVLQETAE